jgi:hypothetical protein
MQKDENKRGCKIGILRHYAIRRKVAGSKPDEEN